MLSPRRPCSDWWMGRSPTYPGSGDASTDFDSTGEGRSGVLLPGLLCTRTGARRAGNGNSTHWRRSRWICAAPDCSARFFLSWCPGFDGSWNDGRPDAVSRTAYTAVWGIITWSSGSHAGVHTLCTVFAQRLWTPSYARWRHSRG